MAKLHSYLFLFLVGLSLSACQSEQTAQVGLELSVEGAGEVRFSGSLSTRCAESCAQQVEAGAELLLTAEPQPGSVFQGWAGDCTGTQPECELTPSADSSVTATFVEAAPGGNLTLTVSTEGTGRGVVTGSGLDCNSQGEPTCSATFEPGATIMLEATPEEGSTFIGWTGVCVEQVAACSFTLSESVQVSAVFGAAPPNALSLTLVKEGEGEGTVTGGGLECGDTCAVQLTAGAALTLTATAAEGSRFGGWRGACEGSSEPQCTFTPTSNTTVSAVFNVLTSYPLSVKLLGTGTGSVSSDPAGITCGETCQATFPADTVVTLSAAPAEGSSFGGWQSPFCQNTNPTCAVSLSEASVVNAIFNPRTQQSRTIKSLIRNGADDAEEYLSAVTVIGENFAANATDANSGDIDMVFDNLGRTNQLVGLRFRDLTIPRGAVITEARIQFTIDHGSDIETDLQIYAQADAQAPAFVHQAVRNISDRPRTQAFTRWQPEPWPEDEGATLDIGLTPDLSAVVQEVVDRSDWERGDNGLVFIITGSGQRRAASFEDTPDRQPELIVTYLE